jgi:hypothetical protein
MKDVTQKEEHDTHLRERSFVKAETLGEVLLLGDPHKVQTSEEQEGEKNLKLNVTLCILIQRILTLIYSILHTI